MGLQPIDEEEDEEEKKRKTTKKKKEEVIYRGISNGIVFTLILRSVTTGPLC